MVTTPDGDIQRADESYLRKAVATRIRRQLVEELMTNKPGKYSIKGNIAALWERESEYMLAHPTWPEKLPRFMLRCISGSVRYNAEIAAEYPEILLYTANIGGKLTRMNTKCPLCVAAGVRRPGEDTKNHLFRECPQTQAERVSLKQAIEAAVDEATDSNISRGGARAVATAVVARPDYYTGQIDQEVKITITVIDGQ